MNRETYLSEVSSFTVIVCRDVGNRRNCHGEQQLPIVT